MPSPFDFLGHPPVKLKSTQMKSLTLVCTGRMFLQFLDLAVLTFYIIVPVKNNMSDVWINNSREHLAYCTHNY